MKNAKGRGRPWSQPHARRQERVRRPVVAAASIVAGLALAGHTAATALALDTVAVAVESTSLELRDDVTVPVNPKSRRVSFVARSKGAATGGPIVAPAIGSDGDPTLQGSGAGGEVVLYDASGGGDGVIVTLPASGWRVLGSSAAPRGYRYRAASPDEPIQRLELQAGVLRLRGGGERWSYTLDEPIQGRVAVRVRLGTGFVWCAEVDAKQSGRPPTTERSDRPGRFSGAARGPAPGGCAPVPQSVRCDDATGPAPGSVRTRRGTVTGVARGSTWAYLGIPFASPPIGGLRWRPPAEPACRTAPLATVAFGARCAQYASGAVTGDEDCLTLNVWTPTSSGGARPVMVWIHGGAHEQGSSSDFPYDGRRLAEREGVVVVTVNYRLGPFGFLAHPALSAEGGIRASGNFGMLDQIAALEWVRDEIAAFGGDPARVTIFGQSAGGVSVCRLLVSPRARGLFSGAILHSGPCVATPLATAESSGVTRVADELGCSAAPDVPACLRAQSTAAVMSTLTPLTGGGTDSIGRQSYDGVIDGWAVPEAPRTLIESGRLAPVPVLLGSTSEENGRFAPQIASQAGYEAAVAAFLGGLGPAVVAAAVAQYPAATYGGFRDAYVALTSDAKFTCQVRQDARRLAQALPAQVRRYWFDDFGDGSSPIVATWGAFHGIDILYAFATLEDLGSIAGPSDLDLIEAMQGAWARFAASGEPDGAGVVWPPYALPAEPSLHLATPLAVLDGVRGEECDFWDALAGGQP